VYWAAAVRALFDTSGMSQEIQEKKASFSSAESILFASDYGGEDQAATYRTYVFLVVNFQSIEPWFTKIRSIYETRFKGMPRTMDFKKLGDGVKQWALPEWLAAANDLDGCLFTLSVHSSIDTLFGQPSEAPEIAKKLKAANLGSWTDSTAEKVLRVLHFQGFISSLLLTDGQKLFWMMDRDSICPNPDKLQELYNTWPRVLYLYLPKGFRIPLARIQTPFVPSKPTIPVKPEDRLYDDTLTYPDLAAGALQEFFAYHINQDGSWKKQNAKKKTVEILRWLAVRGTNLKRFNIRLDCVQENGSLRLMPSIVRLDPASSSMCARLARAVGCAFWKFIERITRSDSGNTDQKSDHFSAKPDKARQRFAKGGG
jgi:hypothetical protein